MYIYIETYRPIFAQLALSPPALPATSSCSLLSARWSHSQPGQVCSGLASGGAGGRAGLLIIRDQSQHHRYRDSFCE